MRTLIALAFLLVSNFVVADTKTYIIDGDTLATNGQRVRLANIDAPESAMRYGQESKNSLRQLCDHKKIALDVQTKDRYGRLVAVVYCDGVNANQEQVRRGLAWTYTRYNQNPQLPALEAQARQGRIGLWEDPTPIAPWEWRRAHKGF